MFYYLPPFGGGLEVFTHSAKDRSEGPETVDTLAYLFRAGDTDILKLVFRDRDVTHKDGVRAESN
jgi:hypothetical protein